MAVVAAAESGTAALLVCILGGFQILMGLGLLLSPAWTFGVLSYTMGYAQVCCASIYHRFPVVSASVMFAYICTLLGVPSILGGQGVFRESAENCEGFYSSYKDDLCRDGWKAMVELMSLLLISTAMAQLLTGLLNVNSTPSAPTQPPTPNNVQADFSRPSSGPAYHQLPEQEASD